MSNWLPMEYYLWMLVAALGLTVGSFVNVLIWRLPRGESILRPRSHCPSCGNQLRWYHNIPVFSWIALRGRCAFCRAPISRLYPVVELICAGLFAAFYARYGVSWTTLGFWYLSATLVAVFFIDWAHQVIPNRLTYPGILAGSLLAMVSPHLKLWQSLVGVLVGAAIFAGIAVLGRWLFRKESMGGGDVKLAAMLGAFLGAGKILMVLIFSAAIGLLVSLAVMAVSPTVRRTRVIPFGPFLAMATVLVCFYGEPVLSYYIRHFLR